MVCKSFDFFYQKIYKTHFKLDLSVNNQKKQVENFINLIAGHYQLPSVGINFIVDYFFFSFAHWSCMKTKRPITLNWIIGKKMFNRWLNRKDGSDYYARKFLKEYDIDLMQIKQTIAEGETEDQELSVAEEIEKQRLTGQARLLNCLHNTTLYHHKSKNCVTCICRKSCKELLHQSNPALFHKRGYVA